MVGWREYAVMRAKHLSKVELPRGVPLSASLGILGATGMTAYFGLLDIGKPKQTDVVLVSAAAGATGSTVAQIAKNVLGCYTVGIAGGPEKCRYLTDDLKLDAAVEYVKCSCFMFRRQNSHRECFSPRSCASRMADDILSVCLLEYIYFC
jgi:NADPH-dependent curcumin reductase